MKVCVSLRDDIKGNLRDDNLRSEGRWERLVLEACTTNPEITEIYTAGYTWPNPTSNKYKGILKPNSPTDCILLLQDWNTSIINLHPFKAAIVNIYAGPWIEQINEVKNALDKYNNNIFFTMGYPVLYKQELGIVETICPLSVLDKSPIIRHTSSHLENFIPRDHIYLLPVPGIPENKFQDQFDKKVLVWAWRPVFTSLFEETKTIQWALRKLQEDSSLRLHLLTGWQPHEVKDLINNEAVFLTEDLNDIFWKSEKLKQYLDIKDRVKLYYSMSWQEAINQFAESKLLIIHGRLYGGPPIEVSTFGIPFIGTGPIGALGECPEYIHTGDEEEACKIFDKLLTDHEYYSKIATAYNKYAIETYSFEAFNNNLNNILKERNLL